MKANNRLEWKQGMLITPETFIESDNYHEFHQIINRKLIIQKSYGLLPRVKFDIECDIIDSDLEIKNIYCEALTINGVLMVIDKKCTFPLPSLPFGKYYLAAKIVASSFFETNEISYEKIEYNYEIKPWAELSDGSYFPIMKLQNESGYWEKMDYIPPCFALSSCRVLKNRFDEIKKISNEIYELIDKKNLDKHLTYSLTLLFLELDNYTQNETPFELLLLLKKISKTIGMLHPDLNSDTDNFLYKEYDHNDIIIIIDYALLLFQNYKSALSIVEKKEEIKEDEPPLEPAPEDWVPII